MANPLVRFAIIVFVAMISGCSEMPETPPSSPKQQVLWPAPPDVPRFKYLGTLRSAADLVEKHAEHDLRLSVTPDLPDVSDEPVIYKPSALAAKNGLVYVAEPAAKAVTVFDLARRKLFRFGVRNPYALKAPKSLALDAAGLVYVLDSEPARVMVYDRLGLFVKSFNLDPKQFTHPVSLAVRPDGQTIYVVDRGGVDSDDHKVVAFAPDGVERFRLGPRGQEPGRFNIPLAAAVGADGMLYVVDAGNFRVQAFDAAGKFKFVFGGAGAQLGQFSRPRSIALDGEGNVYIADASFNNVQIFSPDGQLLMPLGSLSHKVGPGNYALLSGIAVDEANHLYVVDNYFKKIEIFSRLSEAEGKSLMVSR